MSGLPPGWTEATLDQVCSRIVDGSHNPPKAAPSGFAMLSARNIQGRLIQFDEFRWISDSDFIVENLRTKIEPGDVLMTIVGTIGRVAVVPEKVQQFALQRSVAVLKARNATEPRYLAYALETPDVQFFLQANAKGTAQKGIYLGALKEVRFSLAPLPEQKRIADKLDALLARVDACRERLDRVPGILKRFRQAVLAAATSGELTREWREERGGGSEWIHRAFEDIILDGPKNGLYKHSSAYGSGTRILRIDNFYDGYTRPWEEVKRLQVSSKERLDYGLQVGDIVINRVNSLPYLGKAALIRTLPEGCVFESNMMRIRLDLTKVVPEYAILVLASPAGTTQLRRNAKHAVNQASINQTDVRGVEIPLPPLSEQWEIVRRAESLNAMSDAIALHLEKNVRLAARLTPSALAKGFQGELVPQDPNDEPAAELLARIRGAAGSETMKPK